VSGHLQTGGVSEATGRNPPDACSMSSNALPRPAGNRATDKSGAIAPLDE